MRLRNLILTVFLLPLAACAGDASAPPEATGVCDAAAAGRLVGQAPPTEAEARRLTGAMVVRPIAPGQPVTQDFSERRVTIVTDPATSRVVRAGCG